MTQLQPFPTTAFFTGEPQEETLARLEYLQDHGGGWSVVTGPRGCGKTMLLTECARRSQQRQEQVIAWDWGAAVADDWMPLLSQAWNLPADHRSSSSELRRLLGEQMLAAATLRRGIWLLVDQLDEVPAALVREVRWLRGEALRCDARLTIVMAGRIDPDAPLLREETDLLLEMWPWSTLDCTQYLEACCQQANCGSPFTPDAVAALEERSAGMPGVLARLAEWTWLATHAEAEAEIGSDLVHAVADELSPQRRPRASAYELSAAYGAW